MSYSNREVWVQRMFEQYGYTPDPGVIAALTIGIPTDDQAGVAEFEVGAFMNAVNQLNKAAASDPLTKILAQENSAIASDQSLTDKYGSELESVYQQAPKLFGSLTPDQIDEYLQPAKTAFDYSEGAVQTAAAARGNTGSSLEADALAQTKQQFDQGVLATGLQVGQQQQQNQASVIQQLYNQKLQQQNLLYGLQQQTGGQLSTQNYNNAQFLAQLPLLLNSYATQQAQLSNNISNSSPNWENTLGTGLGAVAGAYFGGPIGASIGASLGGSTANDITGNSSPSQTSASIGSNLPLLYGAASNRNNFPGGTGLNWANQPGSTVSGFNSTAQGNYVYGPQGMNMLQGSEYYGQ